ncbi:MAG: sulfurtransferase-like selenium metabolism protein YedF [Venatoribacter sp.]
MTTETAVLAPDLEIDLRGESCPYPLMHTLETLESMKTGELLKVITDCPSSFRNIPAEAKKRQFKTPKEAEKIGAEYVFYIYAP